MTHYTYILSNRHHTVFYVGMTNNIIRRTLEHKNKVNKGFSNKYNVDQLMYFEQLNSRKAALTREKKLKKWRRDWKIELIKGMNPEMRDLFEDL